MKDFKGQEVGVGDEIAYATRRSSSMHMHSATVTEIVEGVGYYKTEALRIRRHQSLEPWNKGGSDKNLMLLYPTFVITKKASSE